MGKLRERIRRRSTGRPNDGTVARDDGGPDIGTPAESAGNVIVSGLAERALRYGVQRSSRLVYTRVFESVDFNTGNDHVKVVAVHQMNRVLDLATILGSRDLAERASAAIAAKQFDVVDLPKLLPPARLPLTPPVDNPAHAAGAVAFRSDTGVGTTEPLSAATAFGSNESVAVGSSSEAETTPPFIELFGNEPDMKERVEAELEPQFGLLFLDRTRITPVSLQIGEHVTTISLMGDEELSLEQKTYTQREVTDETAILTERQFEMEFSSTHSTSLEEGLEQQHQETATESKRGSMNLGVSAFGITLGGSAEASRSIEQANSNAVNVALKSNFEASAKAAAKNRSEHKVVLKLASEQRFEASTRRVIRNPNRHTPVDAHFFKIMQEVELRHERYDARLAWAPCLSNPGKSFHNRLLHTRENVINEAIATVRFPPPPPMPAAVAALAKTTEESVETWPSYEVAGTLIGTVRVLALAPALGGIRSVWDGDIESIRVSTTIEPYGEFTGGSIKARLTKVWVHFAGLAIDFTVTLTGPWATYVQSAKLTCKIRWIMPPDATKTKEVVQQFNEWESRVAAHNAMVATLQNEAQAKAQADAEEITESLIAAINPIDELLAQVAALLTPSKQTLGCVDVEQLTEYFEWEQASFTLLPGWWRPGELPMPQRGAEDFTNAAFAKLYLPIRPGKEMEAVVHVLSSGGSVELSAQVLKAVKSTVDELESHREDYGVSAEVEVDDGDACPKLVDRSKCLGTWTEVVPTDGTHIEVVLSPTTSADALSKATAEADLDGRTATAQRRTALSALASAWAGAEPRSVDVHLHDDQ